MTSARSTFWIPLATVALFSTASAQSNIPISIGPFSTARSPIFNVRAGDVVTISPQRAGSWATVVA